MRHSSILLAGLLAAAAQPSFAAVITSLDGGTAVSMPAANAYGAQAGTLSDGVTWSSSSNSAVLGWTYGYGFALNGSWSGTPMVGLNSETGTMTFTFDRAVSSVLADINWESYTGGATMAIYDTAGALLESAALSTMFTPGSLGFGRDDADIGAFVLANAYIGARTLSFDRPDAVVQTSSRVTPVSAVPEPALWALMIGGFGAVGAVLRHRTLRRRKAAATA
jgi:hypothetical protein